MTLMIIAGLYGVCLLQSGVDKVTDRKGNLDWLTGHFATSPFAKVVPLLLSVLTLMEIGTGLGCVASIAYLLMNNRAVFQYAMVACLLTFLCLFTGQRIAKDYAGAASLVPYFLGPCLGILISEQ